MIKTSRINFSDPATNPRDSAGYCTMERKESRIKRDGWQVIRWSKSVRRNLIFFGIMYETALGRVCRTWNTKKQTRQGFLLKASKGLWVRHGAVDFNKLDFLEPTAPISPKTPTKFHHHDDGVRQNKYPSPQTGCHSLQASKGTRSEPDVHQSPSYNAASLRFGDCRNPKHHPPLAPACREYRGAWKPRSYGGLEKGDTEALNTAITAKNSQISACWDLGRTRLADKLCT